MKNERNCNFEIIGKKKHNFSKKKKKNQFEREKKSYRRKFTFSEEECILLALPPDAVGLGAAPSEGDSNPLSSWSCGDGGWW